jgi:hypothetical protein
MAIDIPQSDLSRAPGADPDMEFPDHVELRLVWGKKHRAHQISAQEFFGRGGYGAPIPAEALVQHINRLRKLGRPE